MLNAELLLQFFNLLIEILITVVLGKGVIVHLTAQTLQMVPNVLNCDFFLRRFLILVAIIMAEVPGVQDIVPQRITMIS